MSLNERVPRRILSGINFSRNTTDSTVWLSKVTYAGVLSFEERSVEPGMTYLSLALTMPSVQPNVLQKEINARV
jgi:hypothetical protein